MVDARGDLGRRSPVWRSPNAMLSVDAQPGKAGILLEHDADAFRHLAGDRLALEVAVPSVGAGQPGDDLQQRRLPAARRADHGEELARVQVEIDRPERLQTSPAGGGGEDLRDAAQRDMSISVTTPYWVFRLRSSGRKLSSMILLQSISP